MLDVFAKFSLLLDTVPQRQLRTRLEQVSFACIDWASKERHGREELPFFCN